MSFADLKRASSSSFDKLNKELTKLNSNNFERSGDDNRMWKPEVDKAGNGYAVIRFLPAPEGEDIPFVRVWDHGFQGPTGKWYIENSLSSIGEKDPVGELNSKLWNSGLESDKEVARKQKRRLSYYSNIYVVKDPAHPENEGKVFLFKYGKKIFDKINDVMNPAFQDEQPINPFDLWAGANFKLKIRNVEGYRNYDKSEFDSPGALSDNDEELETIYKQEHSLQAFLDRKNFKTYAELENKLNMVLGVNSASPAQRRQLEEESTPAWEPKAAAAAPSFAEKQTPSIPASTTDDDDDDDLAFFKKLAEDD